MSHLLWLIGAIRLENKSWWLLPDPAEDLSRDHYITQILHGLFWQWQCATYLLFSLLKQNKSNLSRNRAAFICWQTAAAVFVRLNLGHQKNQLTRTIANTHKHLAHSHVCNLLHSANTHTRPKIQHITPSHHSGTTRDLTHSQISHMLPVRN